MELKVQTLEVSFGLKYPHGQALCLCCSSVPHSLLHISLGDTLYQAEVSRLQIELETVKAESINQRRRSSAELEEAQRVIRQITVERDSLLSKIEILKQVNGK